MQDKARELLAMFPSKSIRHVYVTKVMSAHLCQLQQHQCPKQASNLRTETSSYTRSSLSHQAQKHGLTQGGKAGTHPSLKGPCADAGRSLLGERRRRCLQGLPPAAMISKGFAPS